MKGTYLQAAACAALLSGGAAFRPGPMLQKPGRPSKRAQLLPRQLPAEPSDVQTITGPNGLNITFKEPGKAGVCETTPGVNSYSGYVNLAPDVHSFFWFFERRHDPANAPLTLWLNGGPGSDSQIGLFQEHGPCNITEDLQSQLNPYSWNEVSNMLYLSQPVGVGFSYGGKGEGSLDDFGSYVPDPVEGRYPIINVTAIDTTDLAAIAAWEVIQAFYAELPQLDSQITSREFALTTESYGGHYGPAFFKYFYDQNAKIENGTCSGTKLNFNSLTIINGIVDEAVQAPYYPEFANYNTYGIKAVNDTVYNYQKFALNMNNGCLQQLEYCAEVDQSTIAGKGICAEAEDMCRDNVESPYYYYSGRGVYDIRHPFDDPTPPTYFIDYLNQATVQEAIGVDLNYSADSNTDIYYAFQLTGDFVYPNFLEDLNMIVNNGIKVALIYGDADYICNWFGGEALSLAVNYTHSAQFAAAGYVPMVVDGIEYGETREYGNFSFTRVYEAGHEVPYYQPLASLQLFNRTINGFDLATGTYKPQPDSATNGTASATHTESYVPLPTSSASTNGTNSAPVPTSSPTSAAAPYRIRGGVGHA